MIFPGMDPYLEHPAFFPGIHGPIIVYLRDQLAPMIRPRYIASVGDRVYVEGPEQRPIGPDVWLRQTSVRDSRLAAAGTDLADEPVLVDVPDMEVHEPYLEILDRESGMQVVTVIELLSPSNKYAGPGREAYLAKQREILSSWVHLVEIDLLRYGPHVLAVPQWRVAARSRYDYLTCISWATPRRNRFAVYPRTVREPLPRIPIPLAGDDPDVPLDIRAALEQAYDAGGYSERIDYGRPCEPPLSAEDEAWAAELTRAAAN